MLDIARPKIEGSIAVGENKRRIGFAEYGEATGRPMVWLHGTPGARRQIPTEAREHAVTHGIRLIGIDRPGVGSSTPYHYANVAAFADDLAKVVDALGIDEFAVIGLSGGGPYTLAAAHAMPERVVAAGILGGVAPRVGPEAIGGGLMELGSFVAPAVEVAGAPIGKVLSTILGVARPIADPAIRIYGRFSPEADRAALARPEFRAMFLNDLLHGGRRRMEAPFNDIVAFAHDWGFRVSDVTVPVRWWHGDADHIVPFEHGEHMVSLLPDAKLFMLPGDSHLSTLNMATDILDEIATLWDQRAALR
ncbi:alpha/beta hydrolase [Gordonia sp. ABSL1-1]|uniref:alpha/beta fold hydrolase n=1 Tax=Gordonia sp. ABSL1-1 TaxID=3053923 RepID=UPI0025748BC4|nr:alpha/beta hydrolase [Gordonia sp. ABSL1-1]MDL9935998.1 alpha/beta hydrolase [Gordonia sp. ABSL1-1]